MRLVAMLSLSLLALIAGCRAQGGKESAMIDGTWIPETAELAGQPFPSEALQTMQLVIRADTYVVTVAGRDDKGTVALLPGVAPAAMEIRGVEGPNQGKSFPAIYELKGDNLRVCYDLAGGAGPTAFTTAVGTQQFLVNYRRVKS